MTVVLFHSHGIGPFDYSSLTPDNLTTVNELAAQRGLILLPTVYLRRDYLPQFVDVMRAFNALKRDSQLANIAGFSMEGPLLGPEGGIPRAGCWLPTIDEWRTLASLGELGLTYMVMAPDAMELSDEIGREVTFGDLLQECYDHGVRIALGHFRRDDPPRSAERLVAVLDVLHQRYQSSPYLVLTDHLFNDMPRTFTHAWRTPKQRERRDAELRAFLATPWETSTLANTLGPVPAALLTATRTGQLTPALNFDGLHVDLDICRRTVEYLGADRLIAMTDDTELNVMAGEQLHQTAANSLRYRDDGIVAAGSCGYPRQVANMRAIGLDTNQIDAMFGRTPSAALTFTPRSHGRTV